MRDWYDDEGTGDRDLKPFMGAVIRFSTLDYSAQLTPIQWKELAIVLAEESDGNIAWSKKAVASFLISERWDQNGRPRTDVPSAPELRAFAKRFSVSDPPSGQPPEPCAKCAPYEGRWQMVKQVQRGQEVEVPIACDCERGEFLARRREADKRRVA